MQSFLELAQAFERDSSGDPTTAYRGYVALIYGGQEERHSLAEAARHRFPTRNCAGRPPPHIRNCRSADPIQLEISYLLLNVSCAACRDPLF